jgi:hypothetical protein
MVRTESISSGRGAMSGWHRVPAIFVSQSWGQGRVWQGGRGKQDKGTVSKTVPSDCLHIVFWRDMRLVKGDKLCGNGGFEPFCGTIRQIRPAFWRLSS